MDAWQELSDLEENSVWERFAAAFAFHPRLAAHSAIREPTPSLTWSIANAVGDQRDHLEDDLNVKVLAAFRRCLQPDQKLYALDWQHSCYWFWPHRFADAASWNAWKVPVLPDGDYYIFLAEDFELGLFGRPWDRTICVFGQALLDAFARHHPALFTNPIRIDGRRV